MDFLFSHDGHTYAKHSECRDGQTTQVLFDQAEEPRVAELHPIEPSGDSE